jgi:hypothetical protein
MRQRECSSGKKFYDNYASAMRIADEQNRHGKVKGDGGAKKKLGAYHCSECKFYHVGSKGELRTKLEHFKRSSPPRVHRMFCLDGDD